jgi:protein-disulfide isomerase
MTQPVSPARRRALVALGGVVCAALAGPAPRRARAEFDQGGADAPDGAVRASDPVLGSAHAPITVIEYFSFSCPHCERFHREVFPAIRERYVETGRIRFVLRDFPLNLAALKAAQAAWCGGRERYVELHDALWAEWSAWIDEAEPDDALVRILVDRGLAPDAARACLGDRELETGVLRTYLLGAQAHGVDRTPTFIVNGEKHTGFIPLARFERILDKIAP